MQTSSTVDPDSTMTWQHNVYTTTWTFLTCTIGSAILKVRYVIDWLRADDMLLCRKLRRQRVEDVPTSRVYQVAMPVRMGVTMYCLLIATLARQ
jgi:hypothetical protein